MYRSRVTDMELTTINNLDSIFLTDLRVKLTGPDNTEGAGVVEVYMDGQWGRVCDNSWDNWDADVVCRQLGFPAAESSTCCGWYFGRGSGPSLMTSVHCEGTEKSLFHCRHTGRNLADCDTSAGVICKLDKPPGEFMCSIRFDFRNIC